jgi:uncharacterized membrane protein
MAEVPPPTDITDNDKLMAAISYPIGILAIIILLVEDMKARPFQKYHAVQALAVNIVLAVILIIASIVTCGFGTLLIPFAFIPLLYWAYKAYQGEYFEIPVITNFVRNQGWV